MKANPKFNCMAGFALSTYNMHWKITDGATSRQNLRYLPGIALLNPLHYSETYNRLGYIITTPSKIGKDNFIFTRGLLLESSTESSHTVSDVFNKLPVLFRHLRYHSLQSQIKINNNIGVIISLNNDDLHRQKMKLELRPEMYVHSYFYNSLLTWKHLRVSENEIFNSFTLPVYEEIVIDAFDALTNRDYRKTILFSAIAVESMLANKYDAIYDKIEIKESKSLPRSNSMHPSIYKTLKDGPFRRLLHEVPLYLLNRSVMIERQKLFEGLLKLYNTRNKIVHLGAPADEENAKLLPLSDQGAKIAFDLLLDIFKWMGIVRFDVLRANRHIKIG